jgi:hypothetical protein
MGMEPCDGKKASTELQRRLICTILFHGHADGPATEKEVRGPRDCRAPPRRPALLAHRGRQHRRARDPHVRHGGPDRRPTDVRHLGHRPRRPHRPRLPRLVQNRRLVLPPRFLRRALLLPRSRRRDRGRRLPRAGVFPSHPFSSFSSPPVSVPRAFLSLRYSHARTHIRRHSISHACARAQTHTHTHTHTHTQAYSFRAMVDSDVDPNELPAKHLGIYKWRQV